MVPYRSPASMVDELLQALEAHVRVLVEDSIDQSFPSEETRE